MATANVSPNSTSDQPDPHLAWAFHATRLLAERELARNDDARDRLTDEIGRLWDLIGSTPARTLAGVLAQLECLNDQLASGCSGEQKRERTALANAAATLVSLEAAS